MSEDKNPFEPDPDFFTSPPDSPGEPDFFTPPPDSPGEPDFFADLDPMPEASPMESYSHVEEESSIPPPPPTPPPTAKPRPDASYVSRPNPIAFPLLMLVMSVALLGTGAFFSKMMSDKGAPAPAPAAATAPASESPPSATADEVKALAAKVEGLTTSLAAATKTITGLQAKIDGLPKPAPAPDVKPIETKLGALEAKFAELAAKPEPAPAPAVDLKPVEGKIADLGKTVAALPARFDEFKSRIEAQEKTIADLKKQLAEKPAPATASNTAATTTEKPAAANSDKPPTPATPSPTTPGVDLESALTAAVGLYRQDQFGPARDAFAKLATSHPNDARVQYYAALSSGFATNQWADGSDALRYVLKGVEREKAGTPAKTAIDSAFAALRPDAKAWLDQYRAQAR